MVKKEATIGVTTGDSDLPAKLWLPYEKATVYRECIDIRQFVSNNYFTAGYEILE